MTKVLPFWCQECKLRFERVFNSPELGIVCPVCLTPFRTDTKKQKTVKRERSVARAARVNRAPARDRRQRRQPDLPLPDEFTADHAGHPLGAGYPTGSPLRLDVFHELSRLWRGESHRMAWERILRLDPCSYCGKRVSGTVDHIEPKTLSVRGLGGAYCWLNLTGACEDCNGSKARQPLLRFLEVRARSRPRTAVPSRYPTKEAA